MDGSAVTDAIAASARATGRAAGAAARTATGARAGRSRRREALVDLLRDGGYEPATDPATGSVRLRNCPYHDLAQRHRDVTCGMNLAWARRRRRGSRAGRRRARPRAGARDVLRRVRRRGRIAGATIPRMPELSLPVARVRGSFLAAMEEFRAEGRGVPGDGTVTGTLIREHGRAWRTPTGFEAFVGWLRDQSLEATPRSGGDVPATELWWIEGDAFLARAQLRHRLDALLFEIGGHIGYDVRPSARRQGHATAMLGAILPVANGLGIDPALDHVQPDQHGVPAGHRAQRWRARGRAAGQASLLGADVPDVRLTRAVGGLMRGRRRLSGSVGPSERPAHARPAPRTSRSARRHGRRAGARTA